ncbi:MFS family permease [Lipingzhangella halophila]|uniref:MFS family permease n=1 Tax=Lipingzhangella halophila TaxID=1783352 RepID=A0A7W7RF83_9ACTN|nr:MFS transporter [Lipingzhangella halophila]MBB4930740.1 MFS family permease [Lipingzhangella halophila]
MTTTPADSERAPGATALMLLLFVSTLTVMAGAILTPVVAVIREALSLNGTQAGLVITAHSLVIAVASPLVGWCVDRWGYRVPLSVGLLVYGAAGGAGLVTESYPALIATRVLFGFGATAVFTGSTVAMLTLYRGRLRDRAMGWRSAAISAGGVVWPLVGGALGTLSWQAPFATYLVGVPLGVALLVLLPNPPASEEVPGRASPLRLLRQPSAIGFSLLMVTTSALLYALVVFIPQRLGEVGVTSPLVVSLFPVTWSAGIALVGLGYARLKQRLSYAALLRVWAATSAAAFLVLGVTSEVVVMWLAVGLFGVSLGIAIPALTVLIGQSAPPELRGQAVALLTTATFGGQVLAPLLLGPVMDATAITTGYLGLAALSAVILAVVWGSRITDPTGTAESTTSPTGG